MSMSIDTQIGKIEVFRNDGSGLAAGPLAEKIRMRLPSGGIVVFDSDDEAVALRDALTAEIERAGSAT